ncbi:MAG: hypothetical protein ACOY5B_09615 [Spirochaetota bacterium]
MLGKVISVLLALAALAGAVLYAQKQGREKPRRDPVFDTSKSGTPTPIDASDAERERIRRENEEHGKKKAGEQPQVNPQQNNQPEDKWPEPKEYPRKKKGPRVMPSSKSYIPE